MRELYRRPNTRVSISLEIESNNVSGFTIVAVLFLPIILPGDGEYQYVILDLMPSLEGLVAARGRVQVYLESRSLSCTLTGVCTTHLVVVVPEATRVGQFIRCMFQLQGQDAWIDVDAVLAKQVPSRIKGHHVWTLELHAPSTLAREVLAAFLSGGSRQTGTHPGVKRPTGSQPRIERTSGSPRTNVPTQRARSDSPPPGVKPKKPPLREEIEAYLESSTPVRALFRQALNDLEHREKPGRRRD